MLKIWSNEAESVYVITDVGQLSQEQFTEKVFAQLTEEEQDEVTEWSGEGVLVGQDEDVSEVVDVKEMTFQQYIDELKGCVEKMLGE